MKWGNDRFKYDKYLLLDGLVKFGNTFKERDPSSISFKEVCDFIDIYVEELYENKRH